jgi:hypothetical protein
MNFVIFKINNRNKIVDDVGIGFLFLKKNALGVKYFIKVFCEI